MTVVLDSEAGVAVITDDRVTATVSDLEGRPGVGPQVMERRTRYRNQEGGYWVQRQTPRPRDMRSQVVCPVAEISCAAVMTDGDEQIIL